MIKLTKYKKIFLADSKNYLQEMNNALIELEKDLQNQELINLLFRKFHSIKGMSATMDYKDINELSHAMESFLSKFRDQSVKLPSPAIDILFEGVKILEKLIEEIASDTPSDIDHKSFIQKMNGFNIGEMADKKVVPISPAAIDHPKLTSIPVESQLLDNLLNIVGEMTTHQSKLLGIDKSIPLLNIQEDLLHMGDLINKLHSEVIQIRLTPLDTLTGGFPRVVRELGKVAGKKINFEIRGEDIKLDRIILEELWDPFIHLIRNAVDHGIECPQVRLRRNKSPEGRITLWTSREKEMVLIGLEDDGNGIDFEKVKNKAIEKGVLTPKKAENIRNGDLLAILTIPGFTTSEKPTEVSGRGVGLDLVKNRIETLGGSLSISSQPQKGCNYIMKLPMDLAIYQAIFIRLNSQVFAIPLTRVASTVEIFEKEIGHTQREKTFMFRGNPMPILDLKELFCIFPQSKRDRKLPLPIVVAEAKDRKVGLIVDELMGCYQIFEKPLGQPLRKIEIFSGTTIWGEGEIVLVLNVEKLWQ